MSTDIATVNESKQLETVEPRDDTITKSELLAIAESTLEPHEFKVIQWFGDTRNHNSALYNGFRNSGYQNDDPTKPRYLKNCNVTRELDRIFGKLEKAGIARARVLDKMTGLSPERIKARTAELLESEDDKTALKAVDIASKIAGLQKTGTNVNVSQNQGIQVNARVIQMTDDDDSVGIDR